MIGVHIIRDNQIKIQNMVVNEMVNK